MRVAPGDAHPLCYEGLVAPLLGAHEDENGHVEAEAPASAIARSKACVTTLCGAGEVQPDRATATELVTGTGTVAVGCPPRFLMFRRYTSYAGVRELERRGWTSPNASARARRRSTEVDLRNVAVRSSPLHLCTAADELETDLPDSWRPRRPAHYRNLRVIGPRVLAPAAVAVAGLASGWC